MAVTGNIGSGKTLFSRLLSQDIVPVLDADKEGKQLLSQQREEIFDMLNLRLSTDYVNTLRDAIVHDRKLFELYNKWIYDNLPDIIADKASAYDDVIVDCALIFEWQIEHIFDRVILIDGGNIEQRSTRKKEMDKELIILLESYQQTVDEKRIKSDIIIDNRYSKEELGEQAFELYNRLFADNNINTVK